MQSIDPGEFVGPRAYFTAFDHRATRYRRHDTLKVRAGRRLKLLLLIKSRVVCAASHLASRFSFEFFRECPELLHEGHVIPALRRDKEDIGALFERSKFKGHQSARSFFEEHVSRVVRWELVDNSAWFRDRFIEELEDDSSIVRSHLSREAHHVVDQLLADVSAEDILGRGAIEDSTRGMRRKERAAILNFRDLLYHLSGSRVVNCESSLPQENYIDYDLADVAGQRTRLSDAEILWKFVIELVLESLQAQMLPVEALDALSFRDVIRMRQPLMDGGFQKKYDRLVGGAVTAPGQGDALLDLGTLDKLRDELDETFRAVFEGEYPEFARRRAKEDAREVLRVGVSAGLSFISFIPGLGPAASGLGVLKEVPALIFNTQQAFRSRRAVEGVDEMVKMREHALQSQIEHADVSEGSAILDMVALLTRAISARLAV